MEPTFYFTKTERKGIILLILSIVLVISLKVLVPFWVKPDINPNWVNEYISLSSFTAEKSIMEQSLEPDFSFDPNELSKEDFIRLGLSDHLAERIIKYRSKGGKFKTSEDFKKIYGMPNDIFDRLEPHLTFNNNHYQSKIKLSNTVPYSGDPLDPNKADSTQLLRIGLKPYVVKNMLNYRAKGGIIKNLEEFRKIYGMDDEQFERAKNHLVFPDVPYEKRPFSYKDLLASEKSEEELRIRLDINTASEAEWEYLRGIGQNTAKRIVEYRTKLGGFHTVEQVKEVWGMSDSLYLFIKPHLLIQTPPGKIKINFLDIETLAAHPYIDWKKAKLLVHYREQHGNYRSKEDIMNIKVLTEDWVDKVLIYFDFEPVRSLR